MKNKNFRQIGYIGGSWAGNIGNSFYNLGAIWILKKIFGDFNVFFIPDPPTITWKKIKQHYNYIKFLEIDLFVFSGPIFDVEIINSYVDIFDALAGKNRKIGFISAGCSKYTEDEALAVSRILNNYDVEFISTRDDVSYNLLKGKVRAPLYNGICTSMFLNDAITVPTVKDEYVVYNFDNYKYPIIDKNGGWKVSWRNSPISFINRPKSFMGMKIISTVNRGYIPNHVLLPYKKKLFRLKDSYYSDLPYGYLSILKSAHIVFSDRVHTCAATLAMGGKTMYIRNSNRSKDGRNNLFSRLAVQKIYSEPIELDFGYINQEKEAMVDFIRELSS